MISYGLFKQDKRTFYDQRDGLPSCNILSAAVDKDGRAWVGTDKGAAFFENGSFVSADLFDGKVQVLFADNAGRLWLACGNTVCTTDGQNRQVLDSVVVSIAQDHKDNLYLVTEEFLYKFDNEFKKCGSVGSKALDMAALGSGEIFVAADGKLLKFSDIGSEAACIPVSGISAAAGDKFGMLWVGTKNGVSVFDSKAYWVAKEKINALCGYNVKKILFGKSGKRYVATDIGLMIYDGAKRHFYGAYYWLPAAKVTAVAESADGNTVWVGTENGVSCIETAMMTLADKAAVYQELTEKYNVRDIGFVAPRTLENGRDLGSGQVNITDNDGLRTGAYLLAQSYRYAATKELEALALARRSVKAMLRLMSVTGVPGLMARCIRKKGDTAYCGDMKKWFDAGEYEWLGDVSSDEMVGHFSALSVFYDFCANDGEKAEICKYLCAVVDHILANNYRLRDADGNNTRWGNWNPDDLNSNIFWSGEHGTNALEMLAFLKIAHHMSGDDKYNDEYIKLIKEEHFAINTMYRKVHDAHTVHIDDNLCFLISLPLFTYETDPDIRQCYLIGMREHWEYERVERNPFLNIIYGALSGECSDLDRGVNSLRELPLVQLETTIINSTRNDLVWDYEPEKFDSKPQLKEPLPYDEKPIVRYNRNHFLADTVRSMPTLLDGANFLLPYWIGRFYGVIGE